MELIIKATQINMEYAGREILNIDNLEIYSYDRIGLVGENGTGKSTLLDILSSKAIPAGCQVQHYGEIVYMPQLDGIDPKDGLDPAAQSRLGVLHLNHEAISGGEETRTKIAAALSKQVHALLADEPTCHLDQCGIRFLINQLNAFDGALLIISHDRCFLDQTVDKIWELKNGKITEYWGGYSDYLQQKKAEHLQQSTQYKALLSERSRLEQSIAEKLKQAQSLDKNTKKYSNENTGRLGHQKSIGSKERKMHNAAKNIEKRIKLLGNIEAPENERSIRFRQNKALELHNKFPIIGSDLNLNFGERILFKNAHFMIPLGSKVALTGGNGIGKTTLLRMMFNQVEGLTISPKAVMGYFAQTGYKFVENQSMISYMQENCDYTVSEIRSVLASMGFRENDLHKSLQILSGGEIIKLLLCQILLGRYNILLMDEPSNYLDIHSAEALEKMMKDYSGTIIFVSHDQRLIDNVATIVYEIQDYKINKVR